MSCGLRAEFCWALMPYSVADVLLEAGFLSVHQLPGSAPTLDPLQKLRSLGEQCWPYIWRAEALRNSVVCVGQRLWDSAPRYKHEQ